MTKTYSSDNPQESIEIGKKIGERLSPGDCVGLVSELGGGKTQLAKGISQGLGAQEDAVSPTFTLINEYQGPIPIFHFDLYRLSAYEELEGIGFSDYLLKNGVVLIEWANRFTQVLEACDYLIFIRLLDGNRRKLVFTNENTGP